MKKTVLFSTIIASILALNVNAGVVVIGNANIEQKLELKDVKKIFLNKKTDINGNALTVFDLKEGDKSRIEFYNLIIGQSEEEIKTYRTGLIFSGKGTPTKEVSDAKSLKSAISSTQGAIGYIDESQVDSSVKILFKP